MFKSDKHTKRINALIWLFGQLGGVESILSLCELVNDGDEYVDLIASAVGLILMTRRSVRRNSQGSDAI